VQSRPLRQRRRGTVLVYFAMLSVILLGMAALVIDVGIAIVTRRQMQTAVDAAAIAALGGHDARDVRPVVGIRAIDAGDSGETMLDGSAGDQVSPPSFE